MEWLKSVVIIFNYKNINKKWKLFLYFLIDFNHFRHMLTGIE